MVILLGFGPGDGGSTPLGTTNTFFRNFMKKILLIGINTRSAINSALKLNFEVFSTSYFSTSDVKPIKNQKIILKEEKDKSCGSFEDNFTSENILNLSKEYLEEVDYIIPISGISSTDFTGEFNQYKKKILGNKNIENIEDKFKFYKKIKKEYLTPDTFIVNDVDEAIEIQKNNPNIKYIIKPAQGSGGYDTNILNTNSQYQLNSDEKWIVQEYIEGVNLSSSVLSNKKEAKTLTNSRLLTENDLEHNNKFRYIGNILPLHSDYKKIDYELKETAEKLIKKFNLIGSNGVDFIANENGIYVIEINPRIQGTYECCEKAFEINMLEKHIDSCLNKEIEIPKAKYYSYKKIIYAPTRNRYEKIDLHNIYDLPHKGSITEQDEPLLTIIEKNRDYNKLCENVEISSKIIYNSIK